MRRLLPDPGPIDVREAIPGLRLRDHAPAHRPYVIANFVASADGRASVDGGSTGLGSDGDKLIFRTLRACADAVLTGGGTMGAEHYGRLVRDPDAVALRARLGLAEQPLAVTVTRRGTLPREIPLLDDPGSHLVVYTGGPLELGNVAAQVTVEQRDPPELTMTRVLADLRARHGVRLLLCEGGPTLFSGLVAEGVADELFLTLAPLLAGGDGGSVTDGLQPDTPGDLRLHWVLEQDGALFLRYGL
jgi:riboflavin biosynthesis pyrimidine reductase